MKNLTRLFKTKAASIDESKYQATFVISDERVCRYCGSMDGQIEKVGVNYFNKGDSLDVEYTGRNGDTLTGTLKFDYDGIKGAPLHSSCRCVLIPILSKV